MRLLPALVAVPLAGALLGACFMGGSSAGDDAGTHDGAAACPNDLPAACPAPAPSYVTDVAPVVAQRCVSCHGPGGVEANHDFTAYDSLFAERTTVLTQVYGCLMPPATSPALAAGERATLLSWLVCGAPNQ